MKKITKTAADQAAKTATPAKSAPSPTKAKKTSSKVSTSSALAAISNSVSPATEQAPVPLSTTIVAQVDVGFGNALYIRGEGPGLSWEKGVVLDCVADDKWSIALEETAKPIVYKFLLNDQTWCKGEDHVAQPGTTATVSPFF